MTTYLFIIIPQLLYYRKIQSCTCIHGFLFQDICLRAFVHALSELLWNHERARSAPLGAVVDGTLADVIIDALVNSLGDKASGVRTSAAKALGRLRQFIKSDELRQEIVARLIRAGFDDEGGQARAIGSVLRTVDSALAGEGLVKELKTLPSSAERRFAIEMLEEVFRPAVAA